MFTNCHDDYGREIMVGDILLSRAGFLLRACGNRKDGFYGSLICDIEDSCRNIPYALNGGHDYVIIYRDPSVINFIY